MAWTANPLQKSTVSAAFNEVTRGPDGSNNLGAVRREQGSTPIAQLKESKFEEYLNRGGLMTLPHDEGGRDATGFDPARELEAVSVYQRPGTII
ncbi:hypothetical protein C8N35_111120 [Breoghania corrubedonensis]|uniref:Uncharacterized protein n=1 Tax=Breoghania corrubedonensis TaxID=665038 RepID=A0A2T5UYU0_9HYPH|nr:hypothetical protein [Breoghania corrubedonensis]PTW56657.1 hypothetical protein C8N35_111120 [Breoghania corrubedonensis]